MNCGNHRLKSEIQKKSDCEEPSLIRDNYAISYNQLTTDLSGDDAVPSDQDTVGKDHSDVQSIVLDLDSLDINLSLVLQGNLTGGARYGQPISVGLR